MLLAFDSLRAAVALLTRIPVGLRPISSAASRLAGIWFPVVGLGVGLMGATVLHFSSALGGWVSATLAIATTALVTGALHEDGLADTADALGATRDRDRMHDILKDSHIGTFGALALILSVALRIGALENLDAKGPLVLVAAQTFSRLPALWLMGTLPYVTPAATARSGAVTRPGWLPVLGGTALAVLFWLGAIRFELFTATALLRGLMALPILAMVLGMVFWRRAGGITGDFLGATTQATEIVVLLALHPS